MSARERERERVTKSARSGCVERVLCTPRRVCMCGLSEPEREREGHKERDRDRDMRIDAHTHTHTRAHTHTHTHTKREIKYMDGEREAGGEVLSHLQTE